MSRRSGITTRRQVHSLLLKWFTCPELREGTQGFTGRPCEVFGGQRLQILTALQSYCPKATEPFTISHRPPCGSAFLGGQANTRGSGPLARELDPGTPGIPGHTWQQALPFTEQMHTQAAFLTLGWYTAWSASHFNHAKVRRTQWHPRLAIWLENPVPL